MIVTDITLRRKGLSLVKFSPPPPKGLPGAEYEGENLLLDRVILSRCQIKKATQLSLQDVKQLILASECYRAKQKAVWLLSVSDHSKKSLLDKLKRTFTTKAAEFAIEQMIEKNYLNEEKYAKNLLEKYKAQNLSLNQIKAKLFQKGVQKEVTEALLNEVDLSDTDYARLIALIEHKYKTKITDEESRRRTVAALRRRGFTFSDIKKALEQICSLQQTEEIY